MGFMMTFSYIYIMWLDQFIHALLPSSPSKQVNFTIIKNKL